MASDPNQPRIGVDEWVDSVQGKREGYRGPIGWLRRGWDSAPPWARLLAFLVPGFWVLWDGKL